MKKYLYILYDALLLLILTGMLFLYTLYHRDDPIIVIAFIVSELYIVPNIWRGLCLIVDMINGPQNKQTVFLGVLNTDSLDFFRVEYTNVFFDEDELHKSYMAFSGAIEETISRGDKIEIEYYKYSRVVLSIKKLNKA